MSKEADVTAAIENYTSSPFDARFPNTNQSKNCWQNYVDFHRCQKVKGEDYEPCEWFKRVYQSQCLASTVDTWNDQRDEGNYASKI